MNTIFLDTSPLGMISNPKSSPENEECRQWLKNLISAGVRVILPEIADYEVRRELLRANKKAGVERLDRLKSSLEYLSITTPAMLEAAALWGQVRRAGKQTADDRALDGDVILAAQALTSGVPTTDITVSTTQYGHLGPFINARRVRDVA